MGGVNAASKASNVAKASKVNNEEALLCWHCWLFSPCWRFKLKLAEMGVLR